MNKKTCRVKKEKAQYLWSNEIVCAWKYHHCVYIVFSWMNGHFATPISQESISKKEKKELTFLALNRHAKPRAMHF